jgi:hypothetical protein
LVYTENTPSPSLIFSWTKHIFAHNTAGTGLRADKEVLFLSTFLISFAQIRHNFHEYPIGLYSLFVARDEAGLPAANSYFGVFTDGVYA